MIRLVATLLILIGILPALAQDKPDAEQEKSYLLTYVEDTLSTPNRRISLQGINGVLSSDASIARITIADREGVWLTIENAEIVWTRSALLGGRLDIDKLSAEKIRVSRKPVPEEGVVPSPEASSFSIPELPVAVELEELNVASVEFGEAVFGLESELQVEGRLKLEGGSLDTALLIKRLDGPGGEFDLKATYDKSTSVLDLDLSIFEPEDGVIANLMNLHQRPSINLGLKGQGPVDGLDLELALDAAETRVLTGRARIREGSEGHRFDVTAEGPVGKLVEPRLRDLFGQRSELAVAGLVRGAGGVAIDRFSLESGALSLAGSFETASDGFPVNIAMDGSIQSAGGSPVVLPVPGGETTVGNAKLAVRFGGEGITTWSGDIVVRDFGTAGFVARDFLVDLGGAAIALDDPAAREITFVVDGKASGLGADDAGLAEAIGDRVDLDVAGVWQAGRPVKLDQVKLEAKALVIELAGEIAEMVFDGKTSLKVDDASVLAAAANRNLAGGIDITADGKIEPVTGSFDLQLDGTLTDFASGTKSLDGLLAGTTRVTGGAARDEAGLIARGLKLESDNFLMRANGRFGLEKADLTADAEIRNLALLSSQVEGQMTFGVTAKGADHLIDITASAEIPSGKLAGRPLTDARLGFEGRREKAGLVGVVNGDGFVGGERVDLTTSIDLRGEQQRFDTITFNAGATKLTGGIAKSDEGPYSGALVLKSEDISTFAALFLQEATGKIDAEITLKTDGDRQDAGINADILNLQMDAITAGSADVKIRLYDLLGVPGADGTLMAENVVAGGMDIAVLAATASRRDAITDFEAGLRLVNRTSVAVAGSLAPEGEGYQLRLTNADLVKDEVLARLAEIATISVTTEQVRFDGTVFDIAGGRLSVDGVAGKTFDLALGLDRVPLAVANAIRPDLGLDGTLTGKATVSGPQSDPQISFDAAGRGISAAALRAAGLPPFTLDAKGETNGRRLAVDASLSSPNGIDVTVVGTVPIDRGAIDLDVALKSFPLAVLNTVVPEQGLGGRLSGKAKVTGPRDRPTAEFSLQADDVRAAPLAEAGFGGLNIAANGRLAGETVTLTNLEASGADGFNLTASGRIPLSGPGLAVSVNGSVPLSIANRQLASRGAVAAGTVSFSARATGTVGNPQIAGSVSTRGARFIDPESNVGLRDITANARLTNQTIILDSVTAKLAAGGSVGASGSIALDAAGGFPANLQIRLNDARYADGTLVVATIDGSLAVTGPLVRDPLISGSLTIRRAEILIPENLPGNGDLLAIEHANPPARVARTLRLARADDGTPVPGRRPGVARLDVSINAPARIFVRGRGLDAELGGSMKLTGPVTNIQPVGGFQLVRGRFSILGKRLNFGDGNITLVGDMDPFLRFTATSQTEGALVIITITGRASDPNIVFSSQPQLPEDEVLARLIFGRGIAELSPLQIAKLAAAAAQFAGAGDVSLLESLRRSSGLDDLDVVTTNDGDAAVRAGRYVRDNVYLGVEAETGGTTRGTINIDITDDLKAKAATGSDGESSIGIFFEKDY